MPTIKAKDKTSDGKRNVWYSDFSEGFLADFPHLADLCVFFNVKPEKLKEELKKFLKDE